MCHIILRYSEKSKESRKDVNYHYRMSTTTDYLTEKIL